MSKTPMMKQYDDAKAACGDALLLFRMGDFYELFFEDAKIAGEKLGLTVTSRDKGVNPIPMAGFPYHQLDTYLAKLIKLGLRAAVCEQVENPKNAKGLVKREVTQLVSAGTVTDENLLDPAVSNFLVAISLPTNSANQSNGSKQENNHAETIGISWIELSTGQFYSTTTSNIHLNDFIARLAPREILVSESTSKDLFVHQQCLLTQRPDWSFGEQRATETLKKHFGTVTLDGFGFDSSDGPALQAAGGILEYVKESHRNVLDHIDTLIPFHSGQFVEIDQATWISLEISRTIRSGSREGSLFAVIDRCSTAMGSRCLGKWLTEPLRSPQEITARLDSVEAYLKNSAVHQAIAGLLKNLCDMQRLVARVATDKVTPRELRAISNSLEILPKLKSNLSTLAGGELGKLEKQLDPCADLTDELDAALLSDPPHQFRDGGFIQDGFDQTLDELRSLASGGKKWIAEYQAKIAQQTGITNLKVGYNKVFGYYLEASNSQRDKIPEYFIRKQTLKNAERFITPELKEYEEKVLHADEQANTLEIEIFEKLRNKTRSHIKQLKSNADAIAQVDVLASFAELAQRQSYCRPEILEERLIEIVNGRHPVLDILEPTGTFVPNDTLIGQDNGEFHLITGPNMAGKSTYIRQVALLVLMAQIGSYVPATSARIGVVDRIFARVGASDELSRGQSTFMVEMTETARILNTATNRSLVILDEIGRGTSTFDGVSLAWAIVEFMHDQIGCFTLFATHYHELTILDQSLERVENFNVAVEEWNDQIVFLHKIIPGAADKSYGIHVAKIAGVPAWVNRRAEQILDQFESEPGSQAHIKIEASTDAAPVQLTLFGPAHHPLLDKIKHVDTDHVTPMSALQLIQNWQRELASSIKDD